MHHTDWLLTKSERANPETRLDARHDGEVAWSEGNLVRPLVHGATYFAELYERLEETRRGDLVFFTDWQGDADERLTGEPGSEVVEVLGRADERGVDVRGLIWRSHWEKLNFNASENRLLGRQLQARGAEALLDMRVRTGGSHHQKLVVIRYRGRAGEGHRLRGRHRPVPLAARRRRAPRRRAGTRDGAGVRRHAAVARRAGSHHRPGRARRGDGLPGAVGGPDPADPAPGLLDPGQAPADGHDPGPAARSSSRRPRRPRAAPRPSSCCGPTRTCAAAATTPSRAAASARVARGYTKALSRARKLIYIEDQYLWGQQVGDVFTEALRRNPGPARDRRRAAVHRPGRRARAQPADAGPGAGDAADDRGRRPTGWRSTGSRTTRARRSTCTPRCA